MHRLLLRSVPLVLTPVLLAVSTFPGQFRVSLPFWLLACASAVVFLCGERRPLPVSLILSVLAVPMFADQAWGLSGVVPYLGAIALADLTARVDSNRVVAVASAAWLAALLLGVELDDHAQRWGAADLTTVAAALGLPLLLGLYLRSQRQIRSAAQSQVRAQERTAMARELHDLVAHHMASIVLRTGVAEHVIDGADPRVAEVLGDVHRTAADALADIRRWQSALRDPDLHEVAMVEPEALWSEIDAAIERTRAAGFAVTADIDRDGTGLDAMARLTVLRVIQESLTNVMKHAEPVGPVTLSVTRRDGGIDIRVDNAGGDESAGGLGIVGMSERLALMGGEFRSGRGERGWEVRAWLPVS
ncbi:MULTISPECIES: sensor histidine kinase [Mycobacteriaceae]|uniref:histidine kinase n=1 Tax=Mycolicibacterium neoaurum VKM Ac-1815D TaxID=700508 RepID=V5X772_MYCNE|nr:MULTISPECIES: histidine kinase [Mycobacteriaceae]AHC23254.1 histidine kinase [Mycolicibacterium neoaurum VKM Ac-1815D]AMO04000.1 histidine kinase [Mycolicibacterium neoaurum]AXK77737.1 two-component sensor histidine kinase [Mycolicibacterium neoaurum]KJQ49794.1 histidine kinase [Mycolicibacterium neoaurum]KUM07572.1 histidine kinase [Mycolicibacterium neoaurum]